MRTFLHSLTLLSSIISGVLALSASGALADFSATRQGPKIVIRGDHFRITVDAAKGGEITGIMLLDGSKWNRVCGGDGQTCPVVRMSDADNEYRLAADPDSQVEDFEATDRRVRFRTVGRPRTDDGRLSPWSVELGYEIYPEGALFIDLDYRLPTGKATLDRSSVSLVIDRSVVGAAKYREEVFTRLSEGFESVRIALGTNPQRSFTNEVQAILEYKTPMTRSVSFDGKDGRFTWSPAAEPGSIDAPFHYHNRVALALGAAKTGRPSTNIIGQRVYHWINYLDRQALDKWYPTDAQIDQMAANGGTVLILHQDWMLQGGSNGNPHADYSVVRHENAVRRVIARAHEKDMHFGFYMRGVEQYALATRFFEKYCKRDWDGLYVDWHGPHCVGYHEHRYQPKTDLGDRHASKDGTYVAARDYFLFTRQLRGVVGPKGFLIGHAGFGNSGVLMNLAFDAYLPGEHGSDHGMFSDRDQAVYSGMMGGGPCMPWPLDSPDFCTPQSVAKMAVWGFYPHVGLGLQRKRDATLFTLEPDDEVNGFPLPYWRLLAAIDVEGATVHNLPCHNRVAATCSNPNFQCLVYEDARSDYLVIVANLSDESGQTAVTLDTRVLGMSGNYRVDRIDPGTGEQARQGTSTNTLTTRKLPPWGLEGFKLTRGNGKSSPPAR